MFALKKTSLFFLSVILSLFLSNKIITAQTLVETTNVSIGAMVGSIPTIDPNSGGGGNAGGIITYQSGVRFSGVAYPNASIFIQKNLSDEISVTADENGNFTALVPENTSQIFTLYAKDASGRQSTILNFPTIFYSGYITDITGIRLAPTIVTDKISVKKNDFLSIEGTGLPNSSIEISISGEEEILLKVPSDRLGVYSVTAPIDLKEGEYIVRSRYTSDSRWSKAIRVTVGSTNIFDNEAKNNIPGDCNFDNRVTISDFSIIAYWFGKGNPPSCVDTNNDKTINLVDFSILAFYWNG